MPAKVVGTETFGRNLRILREQRDMTQKDLSEASKVGQELISRLETGETKARKVRLDTLLKLFDALGVQFDMEYLKTDLKVKISFPGEKVKV